MATAEKPLRMKMKADARLLNSAIVLIGVSMFGCAGNPPSTIGLEEGRLAPCPGTPNCVVSQGGDKQHHIDPISYDGEKTAAVEVIKQVVQGMAGSRIATDSGDYLHVEFKSKMMGFVDDVEFYFPETGVIHMRSASRVGYSDFGVNRKRIETIRQLFQTRLSKDGRK
jgi:uncharacterized protein (DUF1499 family)